MIRKTTELPVGKDPYFVHGLEEGKSEWMQENLLTTPMWKLENFGKPYIFVPSRNESQRKKNIGKPDEGEPHVLFDEGELE